MRFKIINGEILSQSRSFVLLDCMQTQVHMYKLNKQHATVNTYKFFFSNLFVIMECFA